VSGRYAPGGAAAFGSPHIERQVSLGERRRQRLAGREFAAYQGITPGMDFDAFFKHWYHHWSSLLISLAVMAIAVLAAVVGIAFRFRESPAVSSRLSLHVHAPPPPARSALASLTLTPTPPPPPVPRSTCPSSSPCCPYSTSSCSPSSSVSAACSWVCRDAVCEHRQFTLRASSTLNSALSSRTPCPVFSATTLTGCSDECQRQFHAYHRLLLHAAMTAGVLWGLVATLVYWLPSWHYSLLPQAFDLAAAAAPPTTLAAETHLVRFASTVRIDYAHGVSLL
jgi:hypothetical protein